LTFKRDPGLIRSIRGRGYRSPHTQFGRAEKEALSGTEQCSDLDLDERTRTRTSFGGSSFYTAYDDHPGLDDEDEELCRVEGEDRGLARADEGEDGLRLTRRGADVGERRERLELFSVPHPDDVSQYSVVVVRLPVWSNGDLNPSFLETLTTRFVPRKKVIVDNSETETTDMIDLDGAQTTILDRFWASLFAGSSSSFEMSRIRSREGGAGLGTMTVSSWIVDRLVGL
jgi:hypothetical protein